MSREKFYKSMASLGDKLGYRDETIARDVGTISALINERPDLSVSSLKKCAQSKLSPADMAQFRAEVVVAYQKLKPGLSEMEAENELYTNHPLFAELDRLVEYDESPEERMEKQRESRPMLGDPDYLALGKKLDSEVRAHMAKHGLSDDMAWDAYLGTRAGAALYQRYVDAGEAISAREGDN